MARAPLDSRLAERAEALDIRPADAHALRAHAEHLGDLMNQSTMKN
jgi:hypothetical protein